MLDRISYDPHTPISINDIVGNSEIWKEINTSIENNSCTHFVLVGPAGSGKSCFLRYALKNRLVYSVDCTANVGLRDVRDIIRTFARGSRVNGSFRWIHLEHADSISADTQAFLRRMMETTSASCRFVFECRDSGAITEPLLSRCNIVSVKSPELTEAVYECLRRTKRAIDTDVIRQICTSNECNMRSSIQTCLALRYCTDYKRTPVDISLPSFENSADLVTWACATETKCRREGYDLRDVLRFLWPDNMLVTQSISNCTRLGGSSPRALFFDCLRKLAAAESLGKTARAP